MGDKKNKKLKSKSAKVFFWVGLVLLALLLSQLLKSFSRLKSGQAKIAQVEESIKRIKEENEALQEKIKKVESTDYIEKQLRDSLNLAKEGEIVVVLPDKEKLANLAPKIEEEKETALEPNWKKWMRVFGL